MIEILPALCLCLLAVLLADGVVRPLGMTRRIGLRSWPGALMTILIAVIVFGAILVMSGNPKLALIATSALFFVFAIASNAKRRALGEPLVFSDLALAGAIVKHPQFYFSVLPLWQQVAGGAAAVAFAATSAWLAEPSLEMALVGAGLAAAAFGLLAIGVRSKAFSRLVGAPNLHDDVRAHGLAPTLLLYWLRWRDARAALTARALLTAEEGAAPDISLLDKDAVVVVVQCESFAEPSELFASGAVDLPELARARQSAVQWGNLHVSGFGAYTMRTEFGVLFGRKEEDLGFLLYDPYLTALVDPSPALPQRLNKGGWRSFFVHPHDMRFYSRDRILPKAGFDELVAEDHFAKPGQDRGRYVSDADVAVKILELATKAPSATFIYAVTMENHGPWAPRGDASVSSMVDNYNRLVRAGDAMLGQLLDGLSELGRPATLVFFGDHRPTIPGASDPGGEKHTPYVIVQMGTQAPQTQDAQAPRDLTPAQLHQVILDWVPKAASHSSDYQDGDQQDGDQQDSDWQDSDQQDSD